MPFFFSKKNKHHAYEIDGSLLTLTEQEVMQIESRVDRRYFSFFWFLILTIFVLFFIRIYYLSITKGSYYSAISNNNSIRSIILSAPRGKIYDKNSHLLARNIPSVDAIIIPRYFPIEKPLRNNLLTDVMAVLQLSSEEEKTINNLLDSVSSQSLNPLLLKENISQDESLILLERFQDFPGITTTHTAHREYIDSEIFSHVLGYDGKIQLDELGKDPSYLMTDTIGKVGIEKSYENFMRGIHGSVQVEVDSRGFVKKEIGMIKAQAGSDLYLHVDGELQKIIFDQLVQVLDRADTKRAAAVALNPQNGNVLSLVSLPSYDNNLFSGGILASDYQRLTSDIDKPLFNRALSGLYPPGSTVKPGLAIAALMENIISPDREIESKGGIKVGNFYFGDWRVNGYTDMRRAIAVSSDVYFYSIGGGYGAVKGLGIDRMKKYYTLFGFGEKTGIDLPNEAFGFIPDQKWKEEALGEKWFIGNNYHASIGQGYITATPLQIANYTAAIANGGTLYKPRVVSHIISSTGSVTNILPDIIREKFISSSAVGVAAEGMRQTITDGTATILKDIPIPIAGKTGTAQFGTDDRTHSWFTSYAPYDDPRFVLVILVEGQDKNTSSSALLAARNIYEWYAKNR